MVLTLKAGDKVAFLGCSNGCPRTKKVTYEIEQLQQLLMTKYELSVVTYDTIYTDAQTGETYNEQIRATCLQEALQNQDIKAIFDLTGGDLSNETLSALAAIMDIEQPLLQHKYYVGYSDNSVMLNAFMGNPTIFPVNFLLTQIVRDSTGIALNGFERTFIAGEDLFDVRFGNTFGGNLRCSLKLAGTIFWTRQPIEAFLIEGLSGDIAKIRTYLTHLEMIGVFSTLKMLIVGEFTEIEQKNQKDKLQNTVNHYQQKYGFKVQYTDKIGHKLSVYPFKYKT